MSAVARGSKQRQVAIAESTFGVTPATPTMVELPMVTIQRTGTLDILKSAQIRTHPFVDQITEGMFVNTIATEFELQDMTHDILLQTMFGSTFTSKSMKMSDALSSLSWEAQATDLSLYDQFSGMYFDKMDFSVGSSDKTPIKIKLSGGAKAAAYDATSSLATTVTAAGSIVPFSWCDATLTIGGSARPVTNATFSLSRTVNPLNLIGSRVSDQFVPNEVTLTGQVTIPFEDALESARFAGFSDAPLVIRAANPGATAYRTFTIPKTKYSKHVRNIANRGAVMSVIDWEAYYDTSSATIMTVSTE